jgi:hypothetical protein
MRYVLWPFSILGKAGLLQKRTGCPMTALGPQRSFPGQPSPEHPWGTRILNVMGVALVFGAVLALLNLVVTLCCRPY